MVAARGVEELRSPLLDVRLVADAELLGESVGGHVEDGLLGRRHEHLVDRSLGPELLAFVHAVLGGTGPGSQGEEQQRGMADVVGAQVVRRGRGQEPVHALVQEGDAVPEGSAPFERKEVHGDGPAVTLATQGAVEGDHDVVEEDLTELLHPVHGPEGSHGDARRVHVHEECGDAAVGGVHRACPREQHATLRVLGEAGPDLLPADVPPLTGPRGPAGQRGEIAAGARLGEALAPGLVPPKQARAHWPPPDPATRR